MKLMYFMDNSQILGGAAHTLLRQAELMKIAGYDVIIALDNGVGRVCEAYEIFCRKKYMNIVYMPLCAINQPEDIDIFFILEHFEETKQKIEEEKPDILHSVQINPTVELVARKLSIPHVMNIYPAISDFFKLNYVDIFPQYHICDSQYYADIWKRYIQTKSVCIRTVADRVIVNTNRLKADNILNCICVGAVYQQKNQLSVIMACHKALQSGISLKLFIYGNYSGNPYGKECMNYIQRNNLTDCMELKGFCPNMSEIYQKSDVLLCGSTRESYPNVISEALASGTIVISTPVAGVPEVIRDRENGYLCKGYTADDLCEKILELNRDIESGKIYEIMQGAEETYERVHSAESVTDRLEKYYQWVLDSYEGEKKIHIEEFKRIFEKVLDIYYRKEALFSNETKIQKKLWYLHHVENRVKEHIDGKRHFYIWGTGIYGRIVYELVTTFFQEIKVSGFIDSYKSGLYLEKLIYTPDEILENRGNIILVATVNGQNEILKQLESYNKKYIEDYYLFAPRCW